MIKQVQNNYSPPELEKRVQQRWIETDAYCKTKELRASGQDYYFVDGPPYTTGYIHLGTALNKIIKDSIIRYRRMQNFNVRDQPGYDMHGLPIEVRVEKSIGIKSKKDIEDYGIDRFIANCRDFALSHQKMMTEQFKDLGVWMDWDNPYMTIEPTYIEAAWWTLKKAHEKGLLVSSNRVISWCPRCETALAEAEIDYWEERDPSIYVKFPLRNEPDVSLLIWTTTPWTLPANMAVAAHPEYRYAKVRYNREGDEDTIILLEELIEQIGQLEDWESHEVLEIIEGTDLVGTEYIPPLEDEVPVQKNVSGEWVHHVVPSSTVEADMTGLVHIAPGHGPEDFEIGKEFGLDVLCPIDESGKFTAEGGRYEGMFVKKADPVIIEDLCLKGLMFHDDSIDHRYGHCWRCRSGILFRNTDQWYLKVTEVKDLMLSEISRVKWTPEWAGSGREYDWTANARDWCISRQRYWGIPIPVWTCANGHMKVIGSRDDLEGGENYSPNMDLHRPWIDDVVLKCEHCDEDMKRIEDVLDVWFDAGVASWAALGYPREKAEFERWWPAKFITEAHDQTRGWFYSQLGSSCVALERAPYDEVLVHGWMLDGKGLPMSKSKGNVIEPSEVMEEFGADALRFYLLRVSAPWEDVSFQIEGVRNARRTLNILWNVASFATMYMSIDGYDHLASDRVLLKDVLRPEDRWLISRVEGLKSKVSKNIESCDLHRACRIIEEFILEDLSRWYVRLIRDRMWREANDLDKLAAYYTLYEGLMTATKLLAPFCPHITEEIYQAMDGSLDTVHMTDWPVSDNNLISEDLETSMSIMQELVDEITKERQKKNVKLRWPLQRIIVSVDDASTIDHILPMRDVLLSQANIKEIEFISPGEEWDGLILDAAPNLRAIGKAYRQLSTQVADLLKSTSAQDIKDALDRGDLSFDIDGKDIVIEPEMVSFSTSVPDNYAAAEFKHGDLFIDFNMTPELRAEGFAREIIRRIQQMRKDMELDVEENIRAEINASEDIEENLRPWQDHIMKEVRAIEMRFIDNPQGEHKVEWDIEKQDVCIALTSVRES